MKFVYENFYFINIILVMIFQCIWVKAPFDTLEPQRQDRIWKGEMRIRPRPQKAKDTDNKHFKKNI